MSCRGQFWSGFVKTSLVLLCEKVVFAQLPEGIAQLFLRKQIVLEEKLADLRLPDLLMTQQPFHLLRCEQAKTHRCFAKAQSCLQGLKNSQDVLLLHPSEFACDFSESRPAPALPDQGLGDLAPGAIPQ